MSEHIELSKNRAKRLVKAWEGHIANNTQCEACAEPGANCLIHKFFMEIKNKL